MLGLALPDVRFSFLFDRKVFIFYVLRIEFLLRGHSTTTWTEFCHFLTPTPLGGQFLYPERGQKQTFFDPSSHLVHVVIEWPLVQILRSIQREKITRG